MVFVLGQPRHIFSPNVNPTNSFKIAIVGSLCDNAYQLQAWLMTPILNIKAQSRTEEQKVERSRPTLKGHWDSEM